MLDIAKLALNGIVKGIQRSVFSVNIALQFLYIIYLVYALAAKNGSMIANITLLTVSALFLVFYIIMKLRYKKRKRLLHESRRAYRWFKLIMRLYNLGVIIYSANVTADDFNLFSFLLILVIGTMLSIQIAAEVLIFFAERKFKKISENIKNEFSKIINRNGQAKKQQKTPDNQREIIYDVDFVDKGSFKIADEDASEYAENN